MTLSSALEKTVSIRSSCRRKLGNRARLWDCIVRVRQKRASFPKSRLGRRLEEDQNPKESGRNDLEQPRATLAALERSAVVRGNPRNREDMPRGGCQASGAANSRIKQPESQASPHRSPKSSRLGPFPNPLRSLTRTGIVRTSPTRSRFPLSGERSSGLALLPSLKTPLGNLDLVLERPLLLILLQT